MTVGSGYQQLNAPPKREEKRSTGRPTDYTAELADEMCKWLANGGSLRSWCAQEGKPHFSTVYDWLERHEAFSDAYTRARERQAHNDGDRMNAIVEDLQACRVQPDVARVMIDALKWTAGKRLPKSYGDKVQLSGDADGAPIVVTWAKGESA